MGVIRIKYICTLALEQKCYEMCHHMRPHFPALDCTYPTCLNQKRSCIPFVGKYDFWRMRPEGKRQ